MSGFIRLIQSSDGEPILPPGTISFGTATPNTEGTITSFHPIVKSSVNLVSSANYIILDDDGFKDIVVSTGASNRTITLPTAADNEGREFKISKSDSASGLVIIDGEGGELINGQTTQTIFTQYGTCDLICDGIGWIAIISESGNYNPNSSNTTNITTITTYNVGYMRIGDTVTVQIRLDIDHIASSTATSFELTVPIASNFTDNTDGSGTVTVRRSADVDCDSGTITSNSTNNTMKFDYYPSSVGGGATFLTVTGTFVYQIL